MNLTDFLEKTLETHRKEVEEKRKPNVDWDDVQIYFGDSLEVLKRLPDQYVHCVVSSPPYWGLRDYGVEGQIGLEDTIEEFVDKLVEVFREVKRVLRDDGSLWINLGDTYLAQQGKGFNGQKRFNEDNLNVKVKRPSNILPGNTAGIPWRVAFALQDDGWILRQDLIWHKTNPMPESCKNRCTKAHEYLFLLTKQQDYFYDDVAIKEKSVDSESLLGRRLRNPDKFTQQGIKSEYREGFSKIEKGTQYLTKNKRSVWSISSEAFSEAHFATFPRALVRPCIKAGSSEKGCCGECGCPYKRIIETKQLTRDRPNDYVKRTGEDGTGNSCSNSVAGTEVKTLGWEVDCNCNAGIEKCVILDPFVGSGTTLQVAKKLGRKSIGIELNKDYLSLMRKRINA